MPTYVLNGSNRGLGLEWVRQLAAPPENTVIAGVRDLDSDLSDLNALNTHKNVHVLECNLSSQASIQKFGSSIAELVEKTGKKVDYLFSNSAVNVAPQKSSLDMTADDLAENVQINIMGTVYLVQALVPSLASGALIMNMTSGLGSGVRSRGMDPTKCTAYSISKAGVNMLTIHQANDLKSKGIRVICMDPGWVKTRMGGEGALLEPEESVSSMLKVVHGLGKEDTGKFYHSTGEEVPW